MKKLNLLILILSYLLQSSTIFADEIIDFPTITGVAGAIMDYDSGSILWSKDGNSRKTIASMTKVLAVAVIFDEIKAGNINMSDKVSISE